MAESQRNRRARKGLIERAFGCRSAANKDLLETLFTGWSLRSRPFRNIGDRHAHELSHRRQAGVDGGLDQ